MSLCRYVKEIESLEFQIQFSVIGGMEILQLALQRHPTLVSLRSEVAEKRDVEDAVFNRIVLLLGMIESETQISLDESIAAYLFCLFKEKPISAYRASWRILDYGGLWWSVQLAHHVKDTTIQIFESMDVSDRESETVAFGSYESQKWSGDQEISLKFSSLNVSESLPRSKNLAFASIAPGRLTVSSLVPAALSSQKSFEISDASNRKGLFELVR